MTSLLLSILILPDFCYYRALYLILKAQAEKSRIVEKIEKEGEINPLSSRLTMPQSPRRPEKSPSSPDNPVRAVLGADKAREELTHRRRSCL